MHLIRHTARWIAILAVIGLCGCPSAAPTDPVDSTTPTVESIVGAAQNTGVLGATTTPPCIGSGDPVTLMQRAMLDAINLYRIQNDLKPLKYSKKLEKAADAYVRDLSARNFFDHINPEGQGPGDRAFAAGFCHQYVGENIAAGQQSVAAVMEAWKNSPGHNRNMLEADYVYVGMGYYQAPNGRMFWAQEFAIEMP